MSREIKFRGKRLDNNEFIYGSLIVDEISDKHYIAISVYESEKTGEEGCLRVISCEVDKDTVGQYTGLEDKNYKEIYEGDIVNIINSSVDEEDGYFLVKFENGSARYILSDNSLVYDFDNTYANECEIIGGR